MITSVLLVKGYISYCEVVKCVLGDSKLYEQDDVKIC